MGSIMIDQVTNAGAVPALEALVRFSGQRQRLIAHNIANISTPNYRQRDVSVAGFQKALGEAIEQRRGRSGGMHGELRLRGTREIRQGADGSLTLTPSEGGPGVLFHDRNNRSLEHLMQSLAENAGVFRTASDLLRSQTNLIKTAIREAP